jgi:hypothetical protein
MMKSRSNRRKICQGGHRDESTEPWIRAQIGELENSMQNSMQNQSETPETDALIKEETK